MDQPVRRLLALDQASKVSGWAVFEDSELIAHGYFSCEDDDMGLRLQKIREKVCSLIVDYNINEIAFEDIQLQEDVGNNIQTFKILAEVFGVIYELATELQIPSTAVLASTWKSTLKIKGKQRAEQKKNAKKYVLDTFNIDAIQDECDAICIGAHMVKKHPAASEEVFNWE